MNARVELHLPGGLFVDVRDMGSNSRLLTLTLVTLQPGNERGQRELQVLLDEDDARILAAALSRSPEKVEQ